MWLDLKCVARRLGRRRLYSAICVVCIGVAVAASCVAYSLLDATLLAPPADVRVPAELFRATVSVTIGTTRAVPLPAVSFPQYEAMRASLRGRASLGAYITQPVTLGDPASAIVGGAFLTSHEMLEILDLRPTFGRSLTAQDDAPAGEPVAMIGVSFWNREFGRRPDIVGQTVRVNGHPFTIVGVLPPLFDGLNRRRIDVALPLRAVAAEMLADPRALTDRRYFSYSVVGRSSHLPDDLTWLASQLTAAFRRNAVDGPELDPHALLRVTPVMREAIPRLERVSQLSVWVTALTAAMLLLGCFNVAGLVAADTMARRQEVYIRRALGASSRAILRLLVLEASVLGIIGLGAALLLTAVAQRAIYRSALAHLQMDPLRVSAGLILFAQLVAGGVIVVVSTLAAITVTRALRGETNLAIELHRFRRFRFAERLIPSIQVGLAVLLLIAANQFIAVMVRARRADLGLDVEHLVSVDIPGSTPGLADRLREELAGEAGVRGTAVLSAVPFGRRMIDVVQVDPPGRAPASIESAASVVGVTAGFEQVLGLSVVRGRPLLSSDGSESPNVAVVSRRMAEIYWPGTDPIGECLRLGGPTQPCVRVVGIVSDYRTDLFEPAAPQFYIPLDQTNRASGRAVLVRTVAGGRSMKGMVAQAFSRIAPSSGSPRVEAIGESFDRVLAPWGVASWTLVALAGVALLIALLGELASTRLELQRERTNIAVRAALGGSSRQVMRELMTNQLVPFLLGTTAGVVTFILVRNLLAKLTTLRVPVAPLGIVLAVLVFVLGSSAGRIVPIRRELRRPLRELLEAS